jgi:hypothetical protein
MGIKRFATSIYLLLICSCVNAQYDTVTIAKGYELYFKEKYEKAISYFNKVIDNYKNKPEAYIFNPDEPNFELIDALNGRAYCYQALFKDSLALTDYVISVKISGYAMTYNSIGVIYLKQGNLEKAMSYFKQAINRDTTQSNPRNNIAAIYYLNHNYERADSILFDIVTNRVTFNEEKTTYYYNQACIYWRTKNYQKALTAINNQINCLYEICNKAYDDNFKKQHHSMKIICISPKLLLFRADIYEALNQSENTVKDRIAAKKNKPHMFRDEARIGDVYGGRDAFCFDR